MAKYDHGGMPIRRSVIEQVTAKTGIEHHEIQAELVKQLPLYRGLMAEMNKLQISQEILQIVSTGLKIYASRFRS